MNAKISSDKLSGTLRAPGSKSYSQRYILMSGLGESPVSVHGVYFSEDEQVAIGVIRNSGSVLTFDDDTVRIEPNFNCPKFVDVGESATSYRLSLGMLAARKCKTEFVGKKELAKRPVNELLTSLASLGARFDRKDDGFVVMDASDIEVDDIEVDQSRSSQYVSSLLLFMAYSGAEEKKLKVKGTKSSEGYVRITESCLRTMGFDVIRDNDTFRIKKTEAEPLRELYVERDYSSAAFFLILGALASDDGISIEGLPDNSLQADAVIVDTLKNSSDGISIVFSESKIIAKAIKSYVMHVEVDANITPDLAPPVSVLGIFSKDGVTIRNPGRLTIKETDRYGEIIRLAESFGARIEKGEDYLMIKRGQEILNPGTLSFNDHRMVMSAIVAGLASGFEIEYENVEKINKSYPSFLSDLKKVGATIKTQPEL